MKPAPWSRRATGVHAAGHVICFLHQCHFSSSVCEMESGVYTMAFNGSSSGANYLCGGCADVTPKQLFPPVTKRERAPRERVQTTHVCAVDVLTLDCLTGSCADRARTWHWGAVAAIVPALQAAFPLCGGTGCFNGLWTPCSIVSFSQPRPHAGKSICSLPAAHTSGLCLEEASQGLRGAERAEVVPALGRVFRGAAGSLSRCVTAFSVFAHRSLGPTLVSQRVPIQLPSLLLAAWAQLPKWWRR